MSNSEKGFQTLENIKKSGIKTSLDRKNDESTRKGFNQEIKSKLEEIFELQQKIYDQRFNDEKEFDKVELKGNIRILFARLHNLEDELKLLRSEQYKKLGDSLLLDKIELAMPEFNTKPVIDEKNPSEKSMKTWEKALGVAKAASKWKRIWETAKEQQVQQLLEQGENEDDQFDLEKHQKLVEKTKDDILQLRGALYRLNQKKPLTQREVILKGKVSVKLKQLDTKLKELLEKK